MNLALACMFRDEAIYLREWIEFHRIVGVEKFYLTDNLSQDDCMSVLRGYIDDGIVVLRHEPSNEATTSGGMIMHLQNSAFNWAVYQAKEDGIDWLGLLNLDEFLYPIQDSKLQDVLSRFDDNVGQVSINWQMFGHSYKTLSPGDSLVEHLTLTKASEDENRHVKPIVRPEAVDSCVNAHYVDLKPPYVTMNTHFQLRSLEYPWPAWPDPDTSTEEYHVGPFDLPVRKDVMIINHYTLRDLSFVEQKLQWYRCFGYSPEHLEWARNRANDAENTVIHKYLPELKERLQ